MEIFGNELDKQIMLFLLNFKMLKYFVAGKAVGERPTQESDRGEHGKK